MTFQARSVIALDALRAVLDDAVVADSQLSGTPPVLAVPLVHPCVPSEMLRVAVSVRTGKWNFLCLCH